MIKKVILIFILFLSLNNNIKPKSPQERWKADAYDGFDPNNYEQGNPYEMQLLLYNISADSFIMTIELTNCGVEFRNRAGVTNLMLAAAKGLLHITKFIYENASPNFISQNDNSGLNALDHAIINEQQEIVNYFESQGFSY